MQTQKAPAVLLTFAQHSSEGAGGSRTSLRGLPLCLERVMLESISHSPTLHLLRRHARLNKALWPRHYCNGVRRSLLRCFSVSIAKSEGSVVASREPVVCEAWEDCSSDQHGGLLINFACATATATTSQVTNWLSVIHMRTLSSVTASKHLTVWVRLGRQ